MAPVAARPADARWQRETEYGPCCRLYKKDALLACLCNLSAPQQACQAKALQLKGRALRTQGVPHSLGDRCMPRCLLSGDTLCRAGLPVLALPPPGRHTWDLRSMNPMVSKLHLVPG